ncbi:MAG: alpha/beta hydrolase [Acidimicrobiia bacterium]|nr:alpha/beta hydrolase [Acidimicrobiia bacterium]
MLLLEYRGYGGNPGSPSEEGLTRDARAALAHLRGRPDVDPDRIVYLGESLGTGVATNLAIEEPPAAMVLRSPFTSLGAVGASQVPLLPYSWILRDDYATGEVIDQVDAPVLVITGADDEVIPVGQTEDVYEAATEPKELVIVEGADHVDPAFVDGERYLDAVESFVDAWAVAG